MIEMGMKKVYGLIGKIRVGKDSVANFLSETRNFKQLALADQIKEEFGVSKEDFEAAKITGKIDELREKLWDFSAEKKKTNPKYFINKVFDRVLESKKSVIITDIRTEEEMNAFFQLDFKLKRLYWVKDLSDNIYDNGFLIGSKLSRYYLESFSDIKGIINPKTGIYQFYQYLDKFFFLEDIMDFQNFRSHSQQDMEKYLKQFEIKMKG